MEIPEDSLDLAEVGPSAAKFSPVL